MARRACLSIGVSTVLAPGPGETISFENLDGAIVASNAIADWALKSGYGQENVQVVNDEWVDGHENPVTRKRVQDAVEAFFPAGADPIDHLILAFCGHGLTDANVASISWLFSDSLQGKYRVKADSLFGELRMLPIKRITVLSDSCREAPGTIDLLRLDAVRGIVLQGTEGRMKVDRLSACQDGAQAFMVKAATVGAPGKCLFSGVILDALWGQEVTALDNGRVTTTSLAVCVRDRTRVRAQSYRLKLDPDVAVDPEVAVIYDSAHPPAQPRSFQEWPAAVAPIEITPQSSSIAISRGTAMLEVRQPMNFEDAQPSPKEQRQKEALDLKWNLAGFSAPHGANLVVHGSMQQLWCGKGAAKRPAPKNYTVFQAEMLEEGESVLVEFADGKFSPVVLYRDLYAAVARTANGDVFQAYGLPQFQDAYQLALEALQQFAAGTLGVHSVDTLAASLRHGKYGDPTLGAICAHLYHAIADYDNIRRVAYFYADNDQAVPFDVALLGQMAVTVAEDGQRALHVPAVAEREDATHSLPHYATRATPAVTARIGGRCPWLGLGWDYVVDPPTQSMPLVQGLAAYAAEVPRSGFTKLNRKTAKRLAKDWDLLAKA